MPCLLIAAWRDYPSQEGYWPSLGGFISETVVVIHGAPCGCRWSRGPYEAPTVRFCAEGAVVAAQQPEVTAEQYAAAWDSWDYQCSGMTFDPTQDDEYNAAVRRAYERAVELESRNEAR